jgi:hypothetical protein
VESSFFEGLLVRHRLEGLQKIRAQLPVDAEILNTINREVIFTPKS